MEESTLGSFVYRLVCRSQNSSVALRSKSDTLKRIAQGILASIIKNLASPALTMGFFGGLGNCHAGIVLYYCMIGKLTGRYGGTTENGVALIEVGGVGYAVRAPFGFFATTHEGDAVVLFIYTAVREDAIDLYGFLSEEELRFFKQLMSVSGIGPKSAIAILNVADVSTLKRAVAGGDASMLTKVYGIGKKSAERIVVELRDKLAGESEARGEVVGTSGSDVEVIEALMALGYSTHEARRAIKDIDPTIKGVHERVAAALKYVGSRTTI